MADGAFDVEPTDASPATSRPGPRAVCLVGLALASGIVSLWAFPPVDLPWIVWLGPIGLWYALARSASWKQAALCGFAFGTPYNAQALEFLRVQLGFIPWFPLAMVLALVPAFACVIGWLACRHARLGLRPVIWACAWVIGESLRARLWAVGYTLVDFGYALHGTPVLMQAADLGGVALLTWLIALEGSSAGEALAARRTGPPRWRLLLLPAVLWAAAAGYGLVRLGQPETGTDHRVAIAQPAGDLPQFYEAGARQSTLLEEVSTYCRLLDAASATSAEVILLPESALGSNLDRLPWAADVLAPLTARRSAWLVTGYPEDVALLPAATTRDVAHYNGLGLFDPEGTLRGKYRKRHLIGFGEFVPFREQLAGIYRHFPIRPYDVTPGTDIVTFDAGGIRFSPVICFESLFSADVRQSLRTGGEAIAIHTNDGWFQNDQEAKLHARVAQFRAVENRVYVLRSATTAYSGVIDSRGRWLARVGIDEAGAVEVTARFAKPRSLYYALGDAAMLVPCWALGLGALGVAWRRRAR